ncbi:MAG: hypothetical protein O3A80_02155 [bacterium]|nr:hypothetical protein [bacterium]
MIQHAPSTGWEELNAQQTFERNLLYVSVAFNQMRKYQHDLYDALICDGSEQNKAPDSTYWKGLSERVDNLKALIETDSERKGVQSSSHYNKDQLRMNQVISVA